MNVTITDACRLADGSVALWLEPDDSQLAAVEVYLVDAPPHAEEVAGMRAWADRGVIMLQGQPWAERVADVCYRLVPRSGAGGWTFDQALGGYSPFDD